MQINNINQIFNNKIQNINSQLPRGIKISNKFENILKEKQSSNSTSETPNLNDMNLLLNNNVFNSDSTNPLQNSNMSMINQVNLFKKLYNNGTIK